LQIIGQDRAVFGQDGLVRRDGFVLDNTGAATLMFP
jgi:hypothetical protein